VDGSRNNALAVVDLSRGVRSWTSEPHAGRKRRGCSPVRKPSLLAGSTDIPIVVDAIVAALSRVAPGDEPYFKANAEHYTRELTTRIAVWEKTLKPLAGKKVLTFHKSWTYFAEWAGIVIAGQVEPKPGVPEPEPYGRDGHTCPVGRHHGDHRGAVLRRRRGGADRTVLRGHGLRLPTSVGGSGKRRTTSP